MSTITNLAPWRESTDPPSLTICPDCKVDAWLFLEDGREVHEDFYVSRELWQQAAPDDPGPAALDALDDAAPDDPRWDEDPGFVLCIACFERRLGRRLRREDFTTQPGDLFGTPPSQRWVSRCAQ
jgi:hypothetical protein